MRIFCEFIVNKEKETCFDSLIELKEYTIIEKANAGLIFIENLR